MSLIIYICWVLFLIAIVYIALIIRYCNRVVDNVTVLQCTHTTFRPELLEERQPIVCEGFDGTSVFQKLQQAKSVEALDTLDVYDSVRHLGPWMCSPSPVKSVPHQDVSPEQNQPVYTKNTSMVFLLVQTKGAVNVCLVHPHHMADTPKYTEIVLREGSALFVPYKWWYAVVSDKRTEESRSDALSWTPWVSVCV